MIAGIFHQGSGLGNQLHRYVATRVLAEDKGYEWGMFYFHDGSGKEEGFKGRNIFKEPLPALLTNVTFPKPGGGLWKSWSEKKVVENGVDIRSYDPEFNFIEDGTIIEGEFQDERYFRHRLPEINKWLAVEPLDPPDNLCVIAFRGGEYTAVKDLFLPKSYWEAAIEIKRRREPNMTFQVHTDDVYTSKQFFPDFECIHDIGLNWRSIRYAKHLILSNSSFGIFPALLNETKEDIIAPRYWARRNTGVWALPQNYYGRFHYI